MAEKTMAGNDISTMDYKQVIDQFKCDNEYNNEIAIYNEITFSQDILSEKPTRLDMLVFALCVKGTSEFQINLKSYTIESGDMVILFPGQIVYNKRSSIENCLLISVSRTLMDSLVPRNKSLMDVIFYILNNPVIKTDEHGEKTIKEYIDFIISRINSFKGRKQMFGNEVIKNIAMAMLYEVLDMVSKEVMVENKSLTRKDEIFRHFLKLLTEYYNKDRSVAFYADKICVNPKHLSNVIKELTGKTAGEWIDEHVIMEAKVLLKSSNMTVQEVSQILNFPNQSFFGKYFKKHTGMRPGEYRNS